MPLPSPAVLLQAASVVLAMGTLALWPPQRGAILLIPLTGRPARLVDATMAAGGHVMGVGPIAGSLVVRGDRTRIGAAIGGHDVLIVAARPGWCGAAAGDASL